MNKHKYPRTYHLQYSPGATSDDKTLQNHDGFIGKRVIVTLKLDGENTTIGKNYMHARSLDSANHPSRNWVKGFASTFQHYIGKDQRICGENVYARHSLAYENLESYFYGFSFWQDLICANWDFTISIFERWGITPVEVIYDGIYDEDKIRNLIESLDFTKVEGAVVRVADDFGYSDFNTYVGKYVRPNHVTTEDHWAHQTIIPNGLK